MRRYDASKPLLGLQVLLLTFSLWLAIGCSGDDQARTPAVSTTASGTEATSAASATPSATATPSRPPLPPIVIEVAEAIRDGDAGKLNQLLGGVPYPCGLTPTPGAVDAPYSPLPTCPPGASPGTLVGQYIRHGDCHGGAAEPGPWVVDRIMKWRNQERAELYAAVSKTMEIPSQKPVYYLVYEVDPGLGRTFGRAVAVDESGITGVFEGCAGSAEEVVRFRADPDGVVYPPSDVLR